MTAYVGLDLHKDINFVTHPGPESIRLLSEGKIDAYLGFPPEPQEMREQQIGHVVISSTVDRPWSQYFCCMLAGNREFVRTYPVATKRALRAILKAADFCASEPEQSAQFMVEQGYTKRYDHALQVMKAIPYGWREYSAEDTLRFYALRLHEVGMLKSTPQKLLAQGTDWRFLNELKQRVEDVSNRRPRAISEKEKPMQIIQNRRRFLAGAAAAGAAGPCRHHDTSARAEPPPETTKVRFPVFINASDCQAPMYVSEELLQAEGFTDISFVPRHRARFGGLARATARSISTGTFRPRMCARSARALRSRCWPACMSAASN